MSESGTVETRARALVDSLGGFRAGRLRVRQFRLNYSEGRSATLGIYDSQVGNVYAPFHLADGARGGLLVEWSDGRVARTAFDGNTAGDLTPVLQAMCESRYQDDDARAFAGPGRFPATPLFSPAVERIVGGRFKPLYDAIDTIRARARSLRVKKVSGGVHAAAMASIIATSRGLWLAGRSTDYGFSFSFDSVLWDGRSRRRPLGRAELEATIDRAALLLPSLRRTDRRPPSGELRVLLHPHLAAELVQAYLLSNLYGAEVATGQSAFKAEDFRRHRRCLRADLGLVVNPAVPYSSGSFRATAEGLPARREVYVDRGRLVRPIVGMKYARRLGMRPSTPPASMESVEFTAGERVTLTRALREMQEGFLLLGALGVHTQDTTSGDYSLTVPQAIVVRRGALAGSTKAVIAGNLFGALADPATRLVAAPGHRFPALLLTCHVSPG